MKMMRSLKFLNQLALVALALCLSAGVGRAQEIHYNGMFTLPFEAHWGSADLPAGDYTISIPSPATAPYLLYLRGEGETAIIMASAADSKTVSDHSQLTVVNTGGNQTITALEAGQLGLTFDYLVAKPNRKPMAGSTSSSQPKISAVIPVRGAYGSVSGR
jgi:hypothetical protein